MSTALELTREEWRRYAEARGRMAPAELTPEQIEERERLLARLRFAGAWSGEPLVREEQGTYDVHGEP